MKPSKPSAADRTVDMFATPPDPDKREVEVLPGEEKGARETMEAAADGYRDKALAMQEWATSKFGAPDAGGNQYRVSHKGDHYYLEALGKLPGAKTAHSYTGLMLHERDLLNAVTVLVQAVREKQQRDSSK